MNPQVSCPSNDTIAELVCRQLTAAKADEIEAHVADCAPCRRLIGTLAAGSLPRLIGEATVEANPRVDHGADCRYVIREELARGGMGRISIAHDTLLDRTVAIKELLVPNPALATRFKRELSLTARLQHPAIVSVHDGGTWPGGEPFYVMRLVSGEPLDRVIARHDGVAGRIGLLPHAIAMVDALAYAHSQGVIHRDLKPANVLVGDFGETVVIDWGLAKDLRAREPAHDLPDPIDAPAADTILGLVVGTPAYMAPEQARGEAVDERADVYALGAVLYHLLGGVAPYVAASASDVVRAVRTDAPPPLADRARGIPSDLLAIVDKAMARRADDRYATANELAIDLKRFQHGQLVGAHRYTAAQLAIRWLRKHRTAVAVAALAGILLAGVVATSVSRILTAEQRAEQHRADAEELMRFMLTTLHDKLKPLGKLELLGAVADKEHAYFQAHESEQRAGDRFDRVMALGSLAEVQEARGEASAALVELRSALAIADGLAAADPGEPKYQRQISAVRSKVGDILLAQQDASGALREFQAASAIDERLAAQAPDDFAAQDLLAFGLLRLGRVEETLNDTERALAHYRTSLAITMRFAGREPNNVRRLQSLAESHERIGDVLLKRGDPKGALVEQRAALAAAEQVAALDPMDGPAQADVASYHLDVGGVLETDDAVGAIAEYRQAIALDETEIARDPTNAVAQGQYAIAENSLGTVLLGQGDSTGALAAFRAALANVQRRAAAAPTNADVQREQLVAQVHVGEVLWQQGDKAGALPAFEAALKLAEPLAAANPTNLYAQRDLSAALDNVGSAQLARGDATGALARFRAAIAVSTKLAAQDPTNTDVEHDVFSARANTGDALLAQGDTAAALAEYRAAAALANEEATRTPTLPAVRQDLYDSHTKLGDALAARGATDEAVAEYREALEIAAKLAAQFPDTTDWLEALAETHGHLGELWRARKQEASAVSEFHAALVAARALSAHDPENADWKARVRTLAAKTARR